MCSRNNRYLRLGLREIVSFCIAATTLLLAGCASTPEQEAKDRQTEAERTQQKYVGYTTAQLQLKREEIASSIPSVYWGYGIAGMIQQGQIEGKKKEVEMNPDGSMAE